MRLKLSLNLAHYVYGAFFNRAVYIQKKRRGVMVLRGVAIITDYFISKLFFLSEHAQALPRQQPQHAPFREEVLSFFESLNKSRHAAITVKSTITIFSIKNLQFKFLNPLCYPKIFVPIPKSVPAWYIIKVKI